MSGLVSSAIGYKNLSTSRGAGNCSLGYLKAIYSFGYIYLSTSKEAGNSPLGYSFLDHFYGYSYLSTSIGAGNYLVVIKPSGSIVNSV